MPWALGLARQLDAKATLLHVIQLNIAGEELGIPRKRLLLEMAEEARSILRGTVEANGNSPTETGIVIVEGEPYLEIIDQAQKIEAGLIVMTQHHYKGLFRLFHPHTVARVLRQAACPILVIKGSRKQRGGRVSWKPLANHEAAR